MRRPLGVDDFFCSRSNFFFFQRNPPRAETFFLNASEKEWLFHGSPFREWKLLRWEAPSPPTFFSFPRFFRCRLGPGGLSWQWFFLLLKWFVGSRRFFARTPHVTGTPQTDLFATASVPPADGIL